MTQKDDLVSMHIGNTQISLWISMVKEEKTTEFTGVWMLTSLFSVFSHCGSVIRLSIQVCVCVCVCFRLRKVLATFKVFEHF